MCTYVPRKFVGYKTKNFSHSPYFFVKP